MGCETALMYGRFAARRAALQNSNKLLKNNR
jgi:hypothetical protein